MIWLISIIFHFAYLWAYKKCIFAKLCYKKVISRYFLSILKLFSLYHRTNFAKFVSSIEHTKPTGNESYSRKLYTFAHAIKRKKLMKAIAINGSPRKNWNTLILLEMCMEGAKEAGAETEIINLYDLQYKGCTSCFACKLKGVVLDKCAMIDELEPILQKICECDILALGSPIYFSSVTGQMRSFLERLHFPYSSYEGKPSSFGKVINTALIFTMNAPAFAIPLIGYHRIFRYLKKLMKRTFGSCETMVVTETYQFEDYSKYAMTYFDGAKRLKRRNTVFAKECEKAYELGKKLCTSYFIDVPNI